MKNEFIPYEQALALKELGFDGKCFGCYSKQGDFNKTTSNFWDSDSLEMLTDYFKDNDYYCLAPLYQQTFSWFRIQHGLYSTIVPKKSWPDNFVSGIEWYVEICGGDGKEIGPDDTCSYEEAELACLIKLIEIVKSK